MTQRDERALRRQEERYQVRFNHHFWHFWNDYIAPKLPSFPVIADVGPGPGMFLRDLSARLPSAELHGIDTNEAMIDNARSLNYVGSIPKLHLADVETTPLPFDDHSVDLLSMTAVLHAFQDPFTFLREQVARVVKPDGYFMLFDWVRQPMKDYIAQRLIEPGEPEPLRYGRALEQFRIHNKYTLSDWEWILAEVGMTIQEQTTEPHPFARLWLLRTC